MVNRVVATCADPHFGKPSHLNAATSHIKEDVESIDELKKSTLASYAKAAARDAVHHFASSARHSERGNEKLSNKDADIADKRLHGVHVAVDKLAKKEVQIDELNKSTLASYIKKASDSAVDKASEGGWKHALHLHVDDEKGKDDGEKEDHKAFMRVQGIKKAAGKLAKEEVQIDELKKSTLVSYRDKAGKDLTNHMSALNTAKSKGEWDNHINKAQKRYKGLATAGDKLLGNKKPYRGDREELDEVKKSVSWNPPEVQAKYAKEKKEAKMFASAKREINSQKKKELTKEDNLSGGNTSNNDYSATLPAPVKTKKTNKLGQVAEWMKDSGWHKRTPDTITDKSGAKHTRMSAARDLARRALKKNKEKKAKE
jgi:hypothetical protein